MHIKFKKYFILGTCVTFILTMGIYFVSTPRTIPLYQTTQDVPVDLLKPNKNIRIGHQQASCMGMALSDDKLFLCGDWDGKPWLASYNLEGDLLWNFLADQDGDCESIVIKQEVLYSLHEVPRSELPEQGFGHSGYGGLVMAHDVQSGKLIWSKTSDDLVQESMGTSGIFEFESDTLLVGGSLNWGEKTWLGVLNPKQPTWEKQKIITALGGNLIELKKLGDKKYVGLTWNIGTLFPDHTKLILLDDQLEILGRWSEERVGGRFEIEFLEVIPGKDSFVAIQQGFTNEDTDILSVDVILFSNTLKVLSRKRLEIKTGSTKGQSYSVIKGYLANDTQLHLFVNQNVLEPFESIEYIFDIGGKKIVHLKTATFPVLMNGIHFSKKQKHRFVYKNEWPQETKKWEVHLKKISDTGKLIFDKNLSTLK